MGSNRCGGAVAGAVVGCCEFSPDVRAAGQSLFADRGDPLGVIRLERLAVGGAVHDPALREFRQPLRWGRIVVEVIGALLVLLALVVVFVLVAWTLMVPG